MITLATLPQATEQQIFDQVSKHLLTQMQRSENSDYCAYRDPCGLKCAAGCLIADSEYVAEMDHNMEGSDWEQLIKNGLVPPEHKEFIVKLQQLHDNEDPAQWRHHLTVFAKEHKLVMAVD